MIPPIIHFCWFGESEKPRLSQRCIASWKKYCPEYKIIEWNESNFNVYQHPYLLWCYEQKKWAFLSDFARLLILKDCGGIYLDTDVEVIRPLDDLLRYDAYIGFENNQVINTGQGFGCKKNHPAIIQMAEIYQALEKDEEGNYPSIACPYYNTQALLPYGLVLNGQRQTVLETEILPTDYLNPYDDPTGVLKKTENTYSIHWYGKSWLSKKTVVKSRIMKPMHRIFGTDFILFDAFRNKRK